MQRALTRDLHAISGGTSLAYDSAGNRKTATTGGVLETYNYDADNQLTTVVRGGATIASTTRNALGEVTQYVEYSSASPTGIASERSGISYNARGEVTGETDYQFVNGGTDVNATVSNVYDAYGNLSSNHTINNGAPDTGETWDYRWLGDSAVVSASHFDRDYNSSTNNIYDTWQYYDGQGRLQRAVIDDASNRSVNFALTGDGKVLSSVQNDGTSNDPQEYHLFANGVQVADYTNNENAQSQNFDYQTVIANNTVPTATGSGRFWRNSSSGASGGESGTSGYDPVNPITAGVGENSRSSYIVQSGDTLQGIAQFEWGDSSLWYLIANANGLSADAPLTAGQKLALPLKGSQAAMS
ncbi:MAG TPA: LysM domain-containing protein [Sphingomicrobium sp.]|nr:LysM domain-containing protein [Sphingomicrobium sp.]